ncbi:TAP42-like family [Novymonas esmeraldas]|uniref:TAP42-like family n=1 Tax=Novymonas esmeraldas TaxID=1808958 RepID=A0AAW0F3E4_9TRYP
MASNLDTAAATARDRTTVKGHFIQLCETYTTEVLQTTLASTAAPLNAQIRALIAELEQLWHHLSAVGAFSSNDELDDYSTTALEMLWTPYMVADLYQRIQGPMKPNVDHRARNGGAAQPQHSGSSGGAVGSAEERMRGEDVLVHSERGSGSAAAAAAADAGTTAARPVASDVARTHREEELESMTRQVALARSHAWLMVFFEWMQNATLVDEATVDKYSVHRPEQRTQRIELSRTIASLRATWKAEEDRVGYMRAKRRRMLELMADEGEAVEEAGGEEEEALRERALARLRWSIYEGCHQLQLSSRELSMLEALNPEQRAAISKQYQDTMDAVRRGELSLGRHTYTILPGGMMAAGTLEQPQQVRASDIAQSGGVTAPTVAAVATAAPTTSVAFSGRHNAQLYRQQVRNELMMERNAPTMTLQEFAELEMAEIQRQMDEAQAMQQRQAEEDERLGADGVEERQRHKDSAWDNWKDDHPAYGLTNKGNYS